MYELVFGKKQLEELHAAFSDLYQFIDDIIESFDCIDRNNDGIIDEKDLEASLSSHD